MDQSHGPGTGVLIALGLLGLLLVAGLLRIALLLTSLRLFRR